MVLPETEAANFLSFFFRAKYLSYDYDIRIKLRGNFAIFKFSYKVMGAFPVSNVFFCQHSFIQTE